MKVLLNNTSLFESLRPFNDLGFVPTMGGIHKGHLSLINKSNKLCKKTIVSIFINPKQFNNKKDLKSYPRNLKKDLKILKKLKVNFVYTPLKNQVYRSKNKIKIQILKKDKILCAKYRKGHFEGVLAVVNRLLSNIHSRYMFLGEKDFQQVYLIKKYLQKKFTTKIISCKTVRNKNKLPLSSRNNLLNKNSIKKSEKISQTLLKLKKRIILNFNNINLLRDYKNKINKLCDKIEYLEIRNIKNLSNKLSKNDSKIFIAYRQGNVRLIDNI